MIKVAYIVSTLKRSGPTNQLSYIIKYLDKSKFEPLVITLSPEPQDSLRKRFDKLGIKCISLNLSRIEGFFKAKKKLSEVLMKENIELIHTQGIRADILSSKYLQGYSKVSTLRNYPFEDYPMKFGKVKGIMMALNHVNATKKIKNSIACSKSISKIYKKKSSIQLKFIQNGVDQEQFNRIDDKKDLRKKLKLSPDKKIFISVGSLIPRKDPKTIIDAFKNIERKEDKELIFLGDGFLKKECEESVGKDMSIRLVGNVSNVKEYLQASDYFISTSLSEGLPNTVMEAMACGLPCVLSDIPSHREILEINKGASLIFKIKDTEDLIKKIDGLKIEDYIKMKEASLEIIEKRLNAKFMSNQYQELYLDILGDNNG